MSSDQIGGYLILDLNQPIKWADFRLDVLLADTMLTKLYTTGPKSLLPWFQDYERTKLNFSQKEDFKK
jgi:hypothetical protein